MAKAPKGILGPISGKLSGDVWISPKTGKWYSPRPKHKITYTPEQLERRRRMRLCTRLLRDPYRKLMKPFWGRSRGFVSGWNIALQGTLLNYYEYAGVPYLRPFGVGRYDDPWYSVYMLMPRGSVWIQLKTDYVKPFPPGCNASFWMISGPSLVVWWSGWLGQPGRQRIELPLHGSFSYDGCNFIAATVIRTDSTGVKLLERYNASHWIIGDPIVT
jgi:hypothetical protein